MLEFITGNVRKFSDAYQVFKREGINIKQTPMDIPEIQASSAEEICRAKATYAASKLTGNFFIEDSSFNIPALNGFPGVYVRYVLETLGNEGILAAMKGLKSRECFFRSCIIYREESGQQHEFTFVRDGLFITESAEEAIAGWSDLWRIIGISSKGCHYSKLNIVIQEKLNRDWQRDNTFKRLIKHIQQNS